MKTFKAKSLHAAVLAGLGVAGVAGTAQAVNVNPDGTGQVLLYPYYTVRSDGTANYDNYITIVNSTSSTKAVKVRILEAKRSAEVLDFNLFLSPYDVWAAAIIRTAGGAALISNDRSCTVPSTLFGNKTPDDNAVNAFKNFVYAGSGDGGGDSLDRTREGYIEVLEMGNVTNPTWTGWIKHGSSGTPANCPALDGVDGQMSSGITTPTGGLFGKFEIINPAAGSDFGYDAFSIDNWSLTEQYTAAGSLFPALNGGGGAAAAASSPISNVFTSNNASVITTNWLVAGVTPGDAAADAMSAVMMHNNVFNEYNVLTETDSGTDWVVTFPTKKLYVNPDPNGPSSSPRTRPFGSNFTENCSPENFALTLWDREEQTSVTSVSPSPPRRQNPGALCYEANVITFNNSKLLGAQDGNFNASLLSSAAQVGWARLNFAQANQSMAPGLTARTGAPTYFGLPVIGAMFMDYTNKNAQPGRLATYGANFNHKYSRLITP